MKEMNEGDDDTGSSISCDDMGDDLVEQEKIGSVDM